MKKSTNPSARRRNWTKTNGGVTASGFRHVVILLGLVIVVVDLYFLWPSATSLVREPFIPGVPQPAKGGPARVPGNNVVRLPSASTRRNASASELLPDSVRTSADDKQRVLDLLMEAGLKEIPESVRMKLPTWQQVVQQHGESPVLIGFDACQRFREQVPEALRTLGPAGMFSTGTNLLSQLMKENCRINARVAHFGNQRVSKERLGLRWQVPWGKHTPGMFRDNHTVNGAREIVKDEVLAVVTTRNPWRWIQSMCKNPYAAKWSHYDRCPNLKSDEIQDWNPVSVKYGAGLVNYKSVAHLWNDWYRSYLDASFAFVIIRMEDLIFYTRETVTAVCDCVGGETLHPFSYIIEPAKTGAGHDSTTGLAEAWIKYSQPLKDEAGFSHADYLAAVEALDADLLRLFQYSNP